MLSSTSDIEVRYNVTSVWIDEEPATVLLRGPLEERSEVEELKEVTKH
ncbi:H-type small acid-soluble spore protein [Peribacillus sp. V2I11]|nr:H-type small acid-soluble spore protein [Peribacillus sp. V2I11]